MILCLRPAAGHHPVWRSPAGSGKIDRMDDNTKQTEQESGAESPTNEIQDDRQPREIGGREGPEPTRYGDWEKNGRCIDF
jgi:hypothetical protein